MKFSTVRTPRPLARHALRVLRGLARHGPQPALAINAGVVNRFHREGLTEAIKLPSRFPSHRGALIDHERITDAGRAACGDLSHMQVEE